MKNNSLRVDGTLHPCHGHSWCHRSSRTEGSGSPSFVLPLFRLSVGLVLSALFLGWPSPLGWEAAFGRSAQAADTGRRYHSLDEAADVIAAHLIEHADATDSEVEGAVLPKPFNPAEIPIAADVAEALSRSVLRALLRDTGGAVEVVDPVGLRERINRLREELSLDAFDEAVSRILKESRARLVLKGIVRRWRDEILVTYQLASTDPAHLLAQSREVSIIVPERSAPAPTTLEAAIQAAGKALATDTPDLVTVIDGGLSFGNSDQQTEFGQYVSSHVLDAIIHESRNLLTGRRIRARTLAIDPFDWARLRAGEGLEKILLEEGAYLLTGSYWIQDQAVEIRLELRNREGVLVPWSDFVARRPLERRFLLEPRNIFTDLRDDYIGPVKLNMTSDRGGKPVYEVGENLRFGIKVDVDAYLYCFAQDESGAILQLFPNQFYPKAQVVKQQLLTLPDDLILPGRQEPGGMIWPAERPVGSNVIKCFATQENVEHGLPPAVAARQLQPITGLSGGQLRDSFRSAARGRLSESSMMVLIIEPRRRRGRHGRPW